MLVAQVVLTGTEGTVARKRLKAQELQHSQGIGRAIGSTIKGKVPNSEPVALWIGVNIMCLRWGAVDASARSPEWSSRRMSFFRATVEKDIGSVSISEVRLERMEPYCDSRNRHWRTSWLDSTSEAARDLKTRQLRELSPWVTFNRKENFEHSTRAHMDGQWSAILHPRFMTRSGDEGSSCPARPEKTQAC